jgi:hypothetical protein
LRRVVGRMRELGSSLARDGGGETAMDAPISSEQGSFSRTGERNQALDWPFSHPPRGTCAAGCPSYGRCHCGCGGRPTLSQITHERLGRTAGRPFTFVSGHQLRVAHPRAGIWSRNGVPVEQVRPLIFWLRDRLGSVRAVAVMLQMPEATVRGYVYNSRRKRVPPHAAKRIVRLVLAHRKPNGPLDIWEEQPGIRLPDVLPMMRPPTRRHPVASRTAG